MFHYSLIRLCFARNNLGPSAVFISDEQAEASLQVALRQVASARIDGQTCAKKWGVFLQASRFYANVHVLWVIEVERGGRRGGGAVFVELSLE